MWIESVGTSSPYNRTQGSQGTRLTLHTVQMEYISDGVYFRWSMFQMEYISDGVYFWWSIFHISFQDDSYNIYKLCDTSSGTVVTVSAMFSAEILNFLAKQNLQKGMSSSSPNTLSTFFGPEKHNRCQSTMIFSWNDGKFGLGYNSIIFLWNILFCLYLLILE